MQYSCLDQRILARAYVDGLHGFSGHRTFSWYAVFVVNSV